MVVQSEFDKLGIPLHSLELGEVDTVSEVDSNQKGLLSQQLSSLGFELIDDKRTRVVTKIKSLIIELIYNPDKQIKVNLSGYLSEALHHDYSSLSKLFSEAENTTIEKYFIFQKIERVKELLAYNELSLSEIALKLDYSSIAYLSKQFKDVTGYTPSQYKRLQLKGRKTLDSL
jgi:AraC-like DNA-binding protein